jgi:hypothetical protein
VYNTILLNSVPEEYKIAVSILEAQDQLTPAMIINRIMEEHRKIGADDSSKSKMTMLTNHRKGKSQSKSNANLQSLPKEGTFARQMLDRAPRTASHEEWEFQEGQQSHDINERDVNRIADQQLRCLVPPVGCKGNRVGYDRTGRDAERDSQGRRGVEY